MLASSLEPQVKQSILQEESPLVSVILPVYQGKSLILRAVHSVLSQTYHHLELIIVDDGSTDGSLEPLATLQDKRIKILKQTNQGVAAARNYGFSQAKGTYIAFLDIDDLWFPEKLMREMQTIRQYQEPICIVYSWYYGVDEAERLLNLSPSFQMAGDVSQDVLVYEGLFLPSTSLVHRKIMEDLGGFRQEAYHEDRTFFITACQKYPAFPTKKRLVVYRQSLSGRCRRVLRNYKEALDAELSILSPLRGTLSPEEINQLAILQTRNLLYRFLMYNYMASARKLLQMHTEIITPRLLMRDKKGILALLSLFTGINLLGGCRFFVQTITKYVFSPWWRWKSAPVYDIP